jgi:hypothetical protein
VGHRARERVLARLITLDDETVDAIELIAKRFARDVS